MDALCFEDVTVSYGAVVALDGVSCVVDPGGVHCLAGPNGSGKTTMLRLVAGLTRPDAGRVVVPDGSLGYAFQTPSVYPDLTVRENLAVFGDLAGGDPDWAAELVDRLRLAPALHRETAALSDGFVKKLDLALGLLKRPDVLLLDEPLADLDDVTERNLLALLEEYAEDGRVVVLSSHNLTAFEDVLAHLTVVYDGHLLLDRPVEDLEAAPYDAYMAAVAAHEPG